MLIACLGWGSLVWDPDKLPVHGRWFEDGPFLPIEFARQSDDGRLTLVIVPDRDCVRILWALFSVGTLKEAKEALRRRERIPPKKADEYIGIWERGRGKSKPKEIGVWARKTGLDAVVWTALPFGLCEGGKRQERPPTESDAVEYLRPLLRETKRKAEEYIRRAPRQIETPYRRRFEAEFGWTPIPS